MRLKLSIALLLSSTLGLWTGCGTGEVLVPPAMSDGGLSVHDAAEPAADAGGTLPLDASAPSSDAGAELPDANALPVDTGVAESDAGSPLPDAALPPVDAAVPPLDASLPGPDAGSLPADAGGAPDASATLLDAGPSTPDAGAVANPCVGSQVRMVAKTGSDSNPGTASAPWLTLQRAADSAVSGDVICVEAGTYAERVQSSRSGTAAAPIRFVAAPGETVIVTRGFYVKGTHTTVEGFEITPGSGLGSGARNPDYTYADGAIQLAGSHNAALSNFVHDLQAAAPWAIQSTGDANRVEKNRTHNPYKGHLSASGAGVVVRDNETTIDPAFLDTKPNDWKAISLGIPGATDMLVEGNTFKGPNDGNMIHVTGATANLTFRRNVILLPGVRTSSGTHTQTFGFYASATNLLFDGNIVGTAEPLPPGYVGGFTHFFLGTTNASGVFTQVTFQNNLILGEIDGAYFIKFKEADTLDGLYFYNNLVDLPASWVIPIASSNVFSKNNIVLRGTLGGTRDYNLYPGTVPAGEGSHSRSGNPLFIDPDKSAAAGYGLTANWRLNVGSPAIDHGVLDAHTPATDRGGSSRVGTPDIGPYEYTGYVVPPSP